MINQDYSDIGKRLCSTVKKRTQEMHLVQIQTLSCKHTNVSDTDALHSSSHLI